MKNGEIYLNIENFKSIKDIKNINLYSNQINYFIGENNSGKSNIFDALLFYKNNIEKYKPEINQESDEAYKINKDSIQTKVTLFFEYSERDKREIKKIISKIFVNLDVNTFINENDFKLEWVNTGEVIYTTYPILIKIAEKLDENPLIQNYLAFKKFKKAYELFEKNVNFLLDLQKSTSSSLQNNQIGGILKNLNDLKNIIEKNFIIYSSKENFQIRDQYVLRSLLQKPNEPGYDPEVKRLIDYLILGTNLSYADDIMKFLTSSVLTTNVSLSKRIKSIINSKLTAIFNKYFGNDLNCDLNVEIESQILFLSIIPRENYLFNDFSLKTASDGLNKIVRSVLRLEMLKHNLSQNKNDVFILLIDEPEQNLNPLIQTQYVSLLNNETKELNKESNFFILLSTHSLNIMPNVDIENIPSFVNFVERKPILETHILKDNAINILSDANKYLIEKVNLINSNLSRKDFISKMEKTHKDKSKLNNIFELINEATDMNLPIVKVASKIDDNNIIEIKK